MSDIKLGWADEIGDPPRGPIEFLKFPLFLSLKHLRPRRLKLPWCRTLPRTQDDRHGQNDLYLIKDDSVIVGHCGVNHCESFLWHNVAECKTFLVLVTSNLQILVWVRQKVLLLGMSGVGSGGWSPTMFSLMYSHTYTPTVQFHPRSFTLKQLSKATNHRGIVFLENKQFNGWRV